MGSLVDKSLLVVPNEDGAGPSALVSHVVRHLLDAAGDGLRVTVWNRSRADLNRVLYRGRPEVRVDPVWNLLQLAKDPDTGEVSIPGTLETIGDYEALRERYPEREEPADSGFHAVLDFGVPPAVRWAQGRGIPSVSVLDHAWSRTLEMVFDHQMQASGPDKRLVLEGCRPAWERVVRAVREDEARIRRLFVFPPFLTPPVFRRYWEEIGVPARDVGGVFGGRAERSREEAIVFLRLPEPGCTVLVLGGDTPVWDAALLKLACSLVENPGRLESCSVNLVIFVPYRLLVRQEIRRLDGLRHPRVRRLEYVPGGTIQEILPAVDLVVTRAGGGTVNDAVACRVPLVCVPERTQPQVEAILDACLAEGLARAADPDAFREDPLETLLAEARRVEENRALAERMRLIPTGGEAAVSEAVLQALDSGR